MEDDEEFEDDNVVYDTEDEDVNYEAAKDLEAERFRGIKARIIN